MDTKQKIALGLVAIGSALGFGYMLTRVIKGSGGVYDNPGEIPDGGDTVHGSTPPGYVYDDTTKSFVKLLPASEFKIAQLISGYPTMSVALDVPISDFNSPRVFQAQFALGHWYSSVPEVFTTPAFAPCPQRAPYGECINGRVWKDRYEREAGPDAYTGICPVCGGTGQIDVTPPYPLDISSPIAAIWPELHLTSEAAMKGGIDSSSVNYNYKLGDGVFVASEAVRDILGSPWQFVGGITWQYINVSSRWFRDVNKPDLISAAENPYGTGYQGLVKKANPVPTNYSIIDTEATNIDCGAGYYFDGKTCVPGTHPPNPYKNQKFDVMVVLYEEVPYAPYWRYVPRDYIIAVNAVTTGDAISEHDGSQDKPYLYVSGWQGPGYYMNIPNTSGASIYVATLEDYNNLV